MRKMLKKLGVVIPSVVLTLLMAVGFSTPAFAYVEPEVKEEPVQVIEEEEPTEEEKIPFTIAGNGEVEDNITDDSSKEFFTVKTKGGNLMSLYTNDLDTIQECFGDGVLMFFDALTLGLLLFLFSLIL